jgi:hypothetical protein
MQNAECLTLNAKREGKPHLLSIKRYALRVKPIQLCLIRGQDWWKTVKLIIGQHEGVLHGIV